MSATIDVVVQRLSSPDSGTFASVPPWPHHNTEFGNINRNAKANLPLLRLDVKLKVEAATQLRDNLEHYITGPIYPAFLKKLIPIFINCLKGPPVFISTSSEQVRASAMLLLPYANIL